MDLQLVELLLRVAELGSINRAAANLGLSQPALSRHIAALEHQVGSELLLRSPRGVRLTEAGRTLADRARPLLRQISLLTEQVRQKASGQLAIGTPSAWQHLITAPFVESVKARFPAIALRVHEAVSHLLHEDMAAGLLDIAIVPLEVAPAAGYQTMPLARESMVLVGRAADRLQATRALDLVEISKVGLVLPARPNAARARLEHALERKGLAVNLVMETDSPGLCLELAGYGVGYAVVPASAVCAPGRNQWLSWAPIKGQHVTWALCENSNRSHSQAVREGRRLMEAAVQRALSCRDWLNAQPIC